MKKLSNTRKTLKALLAFFVVGHIGAAERENSEETKLNFGITKIADLDFRILLEATTYHCDRSGHATNLALVCKHWYHLIQGEIKDKNIMEKLSIPLNIPESFRPKNLEETLPFRKFLSGKLIYISKKEEKIELPVSSLLNPLEDSFDLSNCGKTGQFLSISTGYRKVKKDGNEDKIEIWFVPRFLVKRELDGVASHFKPIFPDWKKNTPIGLFWTWGAWKGLGWYDYLITDIFDIPNSNLHEKWRDSRARLPPTRVRIRRPSYSQSATYFSYSFE